MPTTDEKTRKLVALTSYQQLPPSLRSVVKLVLVHGFDGPAAVSILNLPNPTRTWESERVQRCIADYRAGTDNSEDWVARLEAVQLPEPTPPITIPSPQGAPTTAQDAPGQAAEQPKAPEYPLNCPEAIPEFNLNDGARCPRCQLVLCGCGRIFAAEMFRIIGQEGSDEDERHRLVAQYMRQQPDPLF